MATVGICLLVIISISLYWVANSLCTMWILIPNCCYTPVNTRIVWVQFNCDKLFHFTIWVSLPRMIPSSLPVNFHIARSVKIQSSQESGTSFNLTLGSYTILDWDQIILLSRFRSSPLFRICRTNVHPYWCHMFCNMYFMIQKLSSLVWWMEFLATIIKIRYDHSPMSSTAISNLHFNPTWYFVSPH